METSTRTPGRLYRGERIKDRVAITIHVAPGTRHPLDDDLVDEISAPKNRDYPRGFDWGRKTPGAERLAAALLRDALNGLVDPGLARMLADEIVVGLPYLEPWVLWSIDLRAWAASKGALVRS